MAKKSTTAATKPTKAALAQASKVRAAAAGKARRATKGAMPTEAEIEALSAKVVAAVEKAGGKLRA
jgi:hypothetical protein